jgi:hypothetical protein
MSATFRWSSTTRTIFALSAIVSVAPIATQLFLEGAHGQLGTIHATAPVSVQRFAALPSVAGAEPQANRRARDTFASTRHSDAEHLLPFAIASLDAQFDRRTVGGDIAGFSGIERMTDWRQTFRRSARARGRIYVTALSGFYGAAYHDAKARHIIVALRGSDAVPSLDLATFGGMHALAPYATQALQSPESLRAVQHDAAKTFVAILRQRYPDHRISLTGHGVGAILARHTAARLDLAAVTFGAAPMLAQAPTTKTNSHAAILQQAHLSRAADRASALRLEQVVAELTTRLPGPISEPRYLADGAN